MGNIVGKIAPQSTLSQTFPPQPEFNPERDIPDLTGKIIIVTGGNAGIGYHTVKQLLLKNAKVYLAARSPTRCAEAMKQLKEETGREPIMLNLDLADLKSVKKAAEEFLGKEERLDLLFNNAGVMASPPDKLTVQGYDLQFGTNTLGHYFFTTLLLPALSRSTEHHKTKARVIHTSSLMHTFAPTPVGLDWRTMKGGPGRDEALKEYGRMAIWKLYAASKMGNILISHLFTRYHSDEIVSCSVHPGSFVTDLYQYMPGWQRWVIARIMRSPVSFGALTQLWAATTPNADGISGKYFIPWARVGKPHSPANNEITQDVLKAWMEEELKAYF